MVGFGNKLLAEEVPQWHQYYIDYEGLKLKIDDLTAVCNDPNVANVVATAKEHMFQGQLDSEIEKVLAFYKRKLADVLQGVAALKAERAGASNAGATGGGARLDALTDKLRDLACDITRLLCFVSLNMAGVRKILKKLAKHIKPSEPTPGFVVLQISHPHDPGYRITQGTFLSPSVGEDLDAMAAHAELLRAAGEVRAEMATMQRLQQEGGGAAAPTLRRSQSLSAAEAHLAQFDRLCKDMEEAEALAQRNAGLVHAITYQEALAGVFEPPPPDEKATSDAAGLYMNCVVAGLYMANYMLAIPTIRGFCEHIHVSTGLVGVIAGASDFASMFMTPVYSIATNYTFKWPVLAGALACLLSNLLYVLSYDSRALWLLVLSRFTMGFGSSRTVSRRYIADFVSKRDRMRASTAFVCASAIGMALGPLLSLVLARVPTTHVLGLTVNPITVAGWIMLGIWAVFIVAWVALFKEPLAQQQRMLPAAPPASDVERPLLHSNGAHDASEDAEVAATAAAAVKALHGGHAGGRKGSATLGDIPETGVAAEGGSPQQAGWVERWWRSTVPATLACVLCLWALKLVQQGYVDGLPVFTGPLYGWSGSQNGLLLAVLGIASLPVSFILGALSPRISDRALTAGAVGVTAVGAALCTQAGNTRLSAAYFGGGGMLYLGSLILEGAAMCLMSKVIHPNLAAGLFNAGLLTTEAGTLGRFSGNIVMSVVAKITGVETSAQLVSFALTLYGLFAALLVGIAFYMAGVWQRLRT